MNKAFAWVVASILVVGCDIVRSESAELTGTRWVLSTMRVGGSPFTPETNRHHSWEIGFTEDGSFGGQTGCNMVGGSYTEWTDGKIEISIDVMTQKRCPDIDVLEKEMIRPLVEARRFNRTADVLRLRSSSGADPSLVFMRKVDGE